MKVGKGRGGQEGRTFSEKGAGDCVIIPDTSLHSLPSQTPATQAAPSTTAAALT